MRCFSLLFLALLGCAQGASYYVDFSTGVDSANGTATGTPWKHCPGDSNATSTASSTVLAGGDTVNFKGGVTYVGSAGIAVEFRWSGTTGNPIIYDGTNWGGPSKAIITTTNMPSTYAFSSNNNKRSDITIRGFRFYDIGGYADNDPIWQTTNAVTNPNGGVGINFSHDTTFAGNVGDGNNLTITGCDFDEIGQWINTIPMSGTVSITGVGINLGDNTNVFIADCDFQRMKICIGISPDSSTGAILVSNCVMHSRFTWGFDINPGGTGCTVQDITIENCILRDYHELNQDFWMGYGDSPHVDGIFIRSSGVASSWTNNVIKGCTFRHDTNSVGGTASIFISQGPSVDIYNCLFLNDIENDAFINVGFSKANVTYQRVRAWNNTFVGSTKSLRVSVGNSNPDVIEILNNAFYRFTTTQNVIPVELDTAAIGSLVCDYNRYYSDYSPLSDFYVVYNGFYQTLAAWQALGFDTHSTIGPLGLVSLTGVPSTWDAHQATNSALFHAGTVLTNFNTDFSGFSRGAAWDIGAYQFVTNVPPDFAVQRRTKRPTFFGRR